MGKKTLCLIGACILLSAFVFTACDDFYTTSWGTQRKYDLSKVTLTGDNLKGWVDIAVGNPDLAKELAKKIEGMVGDIEDDRERAKFQSYGVELAFEASGVGANVLSNVDIATDMMKAGSDKADEVVKLLDATLVGFDRSVANIVAAIVSYSISGTLPQFNDTYKANTSASTVGEAAVILILAAAPDGGFGSAANLKAKFKEKFNVSGTTTGTGTNTDKTFTPKIQPVSSQDQALAAYLNFIAGYPPRENEKTNKFDDNPITSGLKFIISDVQED